MRVLYITCMDSTKYGGLEKYNISLARKGLDLSLVYNSIPQSKEYLNDIRNHRISLHIIEGTWWMKVWKILRIVQKEKPTIIHYHFGRLVYILSPLFFIFFPRIKQVYTIHCELPCLKRIEHCLMSLTFLCVDLVICVSEGVKSGVIKRFNDKRKIITSYLGVEKKQVNDVNLKSKLGIRENTIVLTSIGFDIDVKGFDLLAESIARMDKMPDVPSYIVLIIGLSKVEENRFNEILRSLDLSERFISVGIRNDVDDFLNITDIYLQPSRTEAISLSIMEAMQYGLPIIAANVGGIPEVCINGKNGLLFEKDNVQALTMHLHRLICDSKLRKSLGGMSIDLSQKFNLSESVVRLIKIYSNL